MCADAVTQAQQLVSETWVFRLQTNVHTLPDIQAKFADPDG